jgi:polyisoprenoid-binding protein YceI
MLALVTTTGCKDEAASVRTAPPSPSSTAAVPSGSAFQIEENGAASFYIDAPLEKIKGRSNKVRGNVAIDLKNLKKASGEIDVDLEALVTQTFAEASENTSQTEHAHNWLEIGSDVEPKRREENRWARFFLRSVEEASAADLATAVEKAGERTVNVTARGDLWLHGVSASKTVKLAATFQGPASAPTRLRVVTVEPMLVSLQEHDVKPRDIAGKFLNGALEKVGKKIDDAVQLSLDVTATPGKP